MYANKNKQKDQRCYMGRNKQKCKGQMGDNGENPEEGGTWIIYLVITLDAVNIKTLKKQ